MKIEEIKDLMSHMKSMGLTNFEYEGQGIKVKMGAEQTLTSVVTSTTSAVPQAVSQSPTMTPVGESEEALTASDTVTSPIVGVFYEAPGPDKAVFAKVGDTIKKGDVLCIVEAMKVMNEIVADKDCKVLKVLCQNEDIVEFGQALFEIEAL